MLSFLHWIFSTWSIYSAGFVWLANSITIALYYITYFGIKYIIKCYQRYTDQKLYMEMRDRTRWLQYKLGETGREWMIGCNYGH